MGQASLAQRNQLQSDLNKLNAAQAAARTELQRQRLLLGQQYQLAIEEAIAENKSELNTMVQNYVDRGYSLSDAQTKALADWGKGLGLDVLGGAFSGFVLAGGVELYNKASPNILNLLTLEGRQAAGLQKNESPTLMDGFQAAFDEDGGTKGIVDKQSATSVNNHQITDNQFGVKNDTPLLLSEQSEITKQRGYPYEKKDAAYEAVEIPLEMAREIEKYIKTVSDTEAKSIHKKLLKHLFMGRQYTNANTLVKENPYKFDVPSKGIGEIINRQPVKTSNYAMLQYLDRILENARYIASEPTSHENRRGVIRTDLFETDTLLGGQPGVAKMRVNATKEGNKLYFATNQTAEGTTPQPWADNRRHHGIEERPSAANPSVHNPQKHVKRKNVDLSKLDAVIREKILALQEAYEKHHREADREELERFLMEGFAQEMG